VDGRLTSLWFGWSIRPLGWDLPTPWDPIAGDYRTADGWIRLHTNAPRHRKAALSVLGVHASRDIVTRTVENWTTEALESAVVAAGGCAATMRSVAEWNSQAQGSAVRTEPLVLRQPTGDARASHWRPNALRPLQGLKVLDLTRVLAGPVATRFLAGLGADVLRIDPPLWDEPAVVPDVTLGKRCARLDLTQQADRACFEALLHQADILVHGYRADALDRLGFDPELRQRLRPGLVDISLNAYGWSGPWRGRRGFDSLVQMSTGIAQAGMQAMKRDKPTPLPVQALDHGTGYLMAAAAVRGVTERMRTGRGLVARLSLARTAQVLTDGTPGSAEGQAVNAEDRDFAPTVEQTGFGPAHRLTSPVRIGEAGLHWTRSAGPLGSADPIWVE
jgi:crotonobetainyl-CoA:carnitine CoA-transferase CaiB-like acyl-CoA transferase